jgi:hypothetical protein
MLADTCITNTVQLRYGDFYLSMFVHINNIRKVVVIVVRSCLVLPCELQAKCCSHSVLNISLNLF